MRKVTKKYLQIIGRVAITLAVVLVLHSSLVIYVNSPEQLKYQQQNLGLILDVDVTLMNAQETFAFTRQKPTFLLIAVVSSASNFETRQIIRRYWNHSVVAPHREFKTHWNASRGEHTDVSIQVLFILARSHDSMINHYVHIENQKYKDIIQGDFIDSYRNLTYKTLFMLNVFNKHYAGTKYLMKIDDNVDLNLAVLLNVLKTLPNDDFILGHVLNESEPIRKRCNEKWYTPEWVYRKQTFPKYAEGPAYILTQNASTRILKVCPKVKEGLHLEDVVFTGLCRKKANVSVRHDARFCQNTGGLCAIKHRKDIVMDEKRRALLLLSEQPHM